MNNTWRFVLYGIGFLLIVFMVWFFSSLVTYLVISAVLATMGRPLVRLINGIKIGRFKLNSSVGAMLTLLLMWLLCFGFFRLMIPIIISKFHYLGTIDINSFIDALEEPIEWITKLLYGEAKSIHDGGFMLFTGQKLASFLNMTELSEIVGSVAGTIGTLFFALFSVSFITFFFLKEEGSFTKGILLLVPSHYEERVEKSLERISSLLTRYFIGIMLQGTIVMVLDAVGLMIIGMNFGDAFLIGLICGLFNVIPYLGPWIGAAIGVVIGVALNINADFMGVVLPMVGLMVIVFVIVQVIDNVVSIPLIYSSSVKAHPLEVFLVIMAAGSLAGVVGMILAIPAYTILRVFGAEFFSNLKIVQKITSQMNRK